MPCGGCAKRRQMLLDVWHRVSGKSVMLNGDRVAQARAEAEAEKHRQSLRQSLRPSKPEEQLIGRRRQWRSL